MLKLDINPKPKIRELKLTTKKLVASNFMGDYPSVFKGRGMIFESFRDYTNNEDASLIDWRASSRAGKLVVREYLEERNLEVFFLVDCSYSMIFGSQKKLKHEYAAELISSMAFAILQKGDSVGLGMFCDGLRSYLPPSYGMIQYRKILRELVNPENYDGPGDLGTAMGVCMQRLKPNTILILITDFLQIDEGWEKPLKVASRKFEIIPLIIRDPRDEEMPEGVGQITVENPYTGEQVLIDAGSIREKYSQMSKELLEQKVKSLKKICAAPPGIMNTKEDFARPIISYLERRKFRWR